MTTSTTPWDAFYLRTDRTSLRPLLICTSVTLVPERPPSTTTLGRPEPPTKPNPLQPTSSLRGLVPGYYCPSTVGPGRPTSQTPHGRTVGHNDPSRGPVRPRTTWRSGLPTPGAVRNPSLTVLGIVGRRPPVTYDPSSSTRPHSHLWSSDVIDLLHRTARYRRSPAATPPPFRVPKNTNTAMVNPQHYPFSAVPNRSHRPTYPDK